MICCSEEGFQELAKEIDARIATETRDRVADLYETLLLTDCRERFEWARINHAIVARWSVSALGYIKRKAWQRIERARKSAGIAPSAAPK